MQLQAQQEIKLTDPEVYTLMAISAITEEAFVTPVEYSSEPDALEAAFEFDPSEVKNEEVQYNEERFQNLLELLDAKSWKLSSDQRRAIEKVLRNRQKAFHMPQEPLPATHLIEHDIVLKDPNKVIFVKPRWTPHHQRPPIEK